MASNQGSGWQERHLEHRNINCTTRWSRNSGPCWTELLSQLIRTTSHLILSDKHLACEQWPQYTVHQETVVFYSSSTSGDEGRWWHTPTRHRSQSGPLSITLSVQLDDHGKMCSRHVDMHAEDALPAGGDSVFKAQKLVAKKTHMKYTAGSLIAKD